MTDCKIRISCLNYYTIGIYIEYNIMISKYKIIMWVRGVASPPTPHKNVSDRKRNI